MFESSKIMMVAHLAKVQLLVDLRCVQLQPAKSFRNIQKQDVCMQQKVRCPSDLVLLFCSDDSDAC